MSNRDLIKQTQNHIDNVDDPNASLLVARKLLVRIVTALQDQAWQDISTAPKDGTKILVWVPETWVCVSWRTVRYMNGWTEWEGDDYQFHPTKWQPLPQPPGDKDDLEA